VGRARPRPAGRRAVGPGRGARPGAVPEPSYGGLWAIGAVLIAVATVCSTHAVLRLLWVADRLDGLRHLQVELVGTASLLP